MARMPVCCLLAIERASEGASRGRSCDVEGMLSFATCRMEVNSEAGLGLLVSVRLDLRIWRMGLKGGTSGRTAGAIERQLRFRRGQHRVCAVSQALSMFGASLEAWWGQGAVFVGALSFATVVEKC